MLKAPLRAYLELTQACNLKCRHCYNDSRFNGNKLQEVPIENIVEKIIEWEVFNVVLSGGETLLRRPQLYSALRSFNEETITTSLNSNLTTFTKEDAKYFVQYNLGGILTSLYSDDSLEHDIISGKPGSYNLTLNGIKIAVREGLPVAINLVGTKMTKDKVYKTGKLAKELGANRFTVSPIVANPNQTEEHLKDSLSSDELMEVLWDLYRLKTDLHIDTGLQRPIIPCFFWEHEKLRYLANNSCGAGKVMANIRPNGDVTYCTTSNKSYGNILKDKLSDIWERVTQITPDEFLHEQCGICDMKQICASGCRSENLTLGLDPKIKHPLMKEPIKYKKAATQRILEGITLVPNFKEANFRDEKEGMYSIMFGIQGWYLVPKSDFDLIQQIVERGGIKIESKSAPPIAMDRLETLLNMGILKIQER